MQHPSSRKRSRVRRHRVPYPLTDTAELFEGGEILRDFGGDFAVVLWKSYKNVMLWAGAHPDERHGLFASGAGERRREEVRATAPEAAVVEPLLEVASLLEAPDVAGSVSLGIACRALSDWAAEREAPASALLFMQAAALASPLDADAACWVGRMARDRAEYARAETWFRQAIVASREVCDWGTYTRSYLGLAKVFWQRGALPTARRCMLRAYRTATRHHLAELRGYALWDLGGIAVQAGRWDEASSLVRSALRIYGTGHAVSLRLVNDIAFGWIKQGWFGPASRMLAAVVPSAGSRRDALLLNGTLARAAGGARQEAVLDRAVARVRELSADPSIAALVPDVWLDVAHGAASIRRWPLAEEAAQTALALAVERGEARVLFEAESTLASVRSERSAGLMVDVPAEMPVSVSALADELELLSGAYDEADAAPMGASA
jgi:tetratricopeptide (TPR) repeat protein